MASVHFIHYTYSGIYYCVSVDAAVTFKELVMTYFILFFCHDNFLNTFEMLNPLNVVDVDILSKCCVC